MSTWSISLDALAEDPARIISLTQVERAETIFRVAGLSALLNQPAMRPSPEAASGPEPANPPRRLTTDETAEFLTKSVDWVKRHAHSIPGAVRIGRNWTFDLDKLQRHLKNREGR